MPTTIIASQETQILGDSSLSENKTIISEAMDRIEVTIPHATSVAIQVDVFTGAIEDVQFLLIKSNLYPVGLSYQVHSTGGTPIILDSMQMFTSAGMLSLLVDVPDMLFFKNIHASVDAIVTIFVGRKATP